MMFMLSYCHSKSDSRVLRLVFVVWLKFYGCWCKIPVFCDVLLMIGWVESILWCPRPRRKLPRWGSFGNDWAERDWMCWRLKGCNFWWLELALPHSLWSKAQCFSISRACICHCREVTQEKDEFLAISSLTQNLEKGLSLAFGSEMLVYDII